MGHVASLMELSISPRKGLHEDCNVSYHPHALLLVRTIIIVLRLFNINKCPDIQHLKLPRGLASGTTTNKVGLASTISALAQLCASTEHEAAADTAETLRHGLQPSCPFFAYYHGANLTFESARLVLLEPTVCFRYNSSPLRNFPNALYLCIVRTRYYIIVSMLLLSSHILVHLHDYSRLFR